MNETAFHKKLNNHLKLNYQMCLDKIHGSIYQAGLPDLIGVCKGRAIYIECKVLKIPKRDTSKITFGVTQLQLHTLQEKEKHGAVSLVACLIQNYEKNICLFLKPSLKLADLEYKITKQALFDTINKIITKKNIGVKVNSIIYL